MVNQIITAEHSAKALAEEGRQKQVEHDCTLTPEQLASMADMSVDEVKAAIRHYEEEIVKLDEVQQRAMKAVEAVYEKNRDAWVDKLFAMIVGVEP